VLIGPAEPIDELHNDNFYAVFYSDDKGNKKPRVKNAIVFSIDVAERLEVAAKQVNQELNDSNAVSLSYPLFNANFSQFEKRKSSKGLEQHCAVGVTFGSNEAAEKLLGYLSTGKQLDNIFGGYFMNHRKVAHVEALLNNKEALVLLVQGVEDVMNRHSNSLFTVIKSASFQLNALEFSNELFRVSCHMQRDEVLMKRCDKRTISKPTSCEYNATLSAFANILHSAILNFDDSVILTLGKISNEYHALIPAYCHHLEMLKSIGLYLLTKHETEVKSSKSSELQNSSNAKLLRKVFGVPAEVFSMQQLALFLEVQETSLSSFLNKEVIEKVINEVSKEVSIEFNKKKTYRSCLITFEEFGKKKKFLSKADFENMLDNFPREMRTFSFIELDDENTKDET
jgi:hypothetical protein